MDVMPADDGVRPGLYQSYLDTSSAPLTSFIFALPLFIVYHGGLWWLNTFVGLRWANAIDIAIAETLGRLGMAGPLLSFLLVVMVFLILNAASGKPWHWPPAYTWLFMVAESLILALPVFMLMRLVTKVFDFIPLSAVDGTDGVLAWQADLILSCGAGVYEEFFFRVVVMGLMLLVLGKLFRIQGPWKYALAMIFQALLFAASHHLPGGPEAIHTLEQARDALPVFGFRTAAGLYFAYLYIERGFGIAAGAHAGYDLLVVSLNIFAPLQ
ncbi:MAG: CPBP family intramembrane metalloprotease [Planctomycetes bacterium]|nr:CPBP family intramembrane metalloprotease [Planctomycetota bacterium]